MVQGFTCCGGVNHGPQRGHILVPGAYVYVPFFGKRGIAYVTKLRIFRWRDHPGVSSGSNVITRVLIRGKQRIRVRKGEERTEAEARVVQPGAKGCRHL